LVPGRSGPADALHGACHSALSDAIGWHPSEKTYTAKAQHKALWELSQPPTRSPMGVFVLVGTVNAVCEPQCSSRREGYRVLGQFLRERPRSAKCLHGPFALVPIAESGLLVDVDLHRLVEHPPPLAVFIPGSRNRNAYAPASPAPDRLTRLSRNKCRFSAEMRLV